LFRAGEHPSSMIAAVAMHDALEGRPRQKIHQLSKQRLAGPRARRPTRRSSRALRSRRPALRAAGGSVAGRRELGCAIRQVTLSEEAAEFCSACEPSPIFRHVFCAGCSAAALALSTGTSGSAPRQDE
jgi:hypothetical protein